MDNKEIFEAEKNREIEKIEKQNQLIEKIKQNNHKTNLLNNENLQKMNSILDKNKKYLHKLKSNEFEIAIVGLEKAGKSTFANALIKANILPSAPERCTFTSTRLTNGNDEAIVEFYSEEEFNKIFRELLKEISYPNYENETYKTVSEEKFQELFQEFEQNSQANLYLSNSYKEIEDIIKYRNGLILTGETKKFIGDELSNDDFKSYIKGEEIAPKTIDTSKPRSVKRIEIKSSKLQKLETAIIYDVPGFDSPTKIHERQTIERLKNADAIILVTNVGRNPSLQGTQLSIITNNSDNDGIPLKDKLFVFGNQLDTANGKQEALGNIEILKAEIAKYKLGEQKRVFAGSALKYLAIDNNIINKPEYKLNYEIDSGIEDIYIELINYYENERFEILKRKIDANKRELKEVLDEILNEFETDFDPNFAENEKNKIIRTTTKNIENLLEKNLKKLKAELKEEILNEKYFSKKFKEEVQNSKYFEEITEDDIKNSQILTDESSTLDIPIEKMNHAIRNELHKRFLKEFSSLIKYMTDEKSKDVQLRILRVFTSSILNNVNNSIFDEIEKESEKLIQKITNDISHNDGRFTYLIERFSRNIFDILISYPLYSNDRKDKFKKAAKEFEYLDRYYEGSNGALIEMILTGEKTSQMESLLKIANRILSLSSKPVGFTNIKELSKQMVNMINNDTSFNIDEILKDKERSQTQKEVLDEINKDIENLRDILENAVTPAINLEFAFFNSIDKQIKLLIDAVNINTNNKNFQIFNDFISKAVLKIKSNELNNINEKLENYKLQREMIEEIKKQEFI